MTALSGRGLTRPWTVRGPTWVGVAAAICTSRRPTPASSMQRDEHDLAALAEHLQDPVAMLLSQITDAGATGFDDPQTGQPEEGDQGELADDNPWCAAISRSPCQRTDCTRPMAPAAPACPYRKRDLGHGAWRPTCCRPPAASTCKAKNWPAGRLQR